MELDRLCFSRKAAFMAAARASWPEVDMTAVVDQLLIRVMPTTVGPVGPLTLPLALDMAGTQVAQ